MDILPDMPGLSKRKAHALNAAFRKQHLESCTEKFRKKFEESEAAAVARGPRPRRKRARRAGACEDESVIHWVATDYANHTLWETFSRKVTPRVMAQDARRAGAPSARPRDFR
ncbi:hypothetical protein [Hyphococcus sp.]|uniref:hypothetical protein n=1 Tax=Hyphococcus sp. TaxID=2038636 RepID=UPI00207E421B|nr:MAG: hypothetical protein DHS20C04_12390 [Marinicaulis sp.]